MKKEEGHPLLRGGQEISNGKDGRRSYSHGFSQSQIQALSAICGALIPSLPPDAAVSGDESSGGDFFAGKGDPPSKTLKDFYLASGSEPPIPDEVAELLVQRNPPEAVTLVKLVLWALSTRLGTLLLCGMLSLTWSFPFVNRFLDMAVGKREAALQRWSREKLIVPLRLFFVIVKTFCFSVFFSRTNESGENPWWKAIGYSLPTVEKKPSRAERPLEKGIIEANLETESSLLQSLADKGLKVAVDGDTYRVECDVVIVGSGSGGGVAAAVLAGAGYKVVVVEKGNYFTAEDYTSIEGPSLRELYEAGSFLSTVDGKISLLAGTTVGGGTAVNWSASIPTPEEVRREWSEELRLPMFQSMEFLSATEKVWERLGVTEKCTEEGFTNKVLRRGCEELGLSVQPVGRNSPENHFCGSCCYGCRSGAKRGTDTTWLVDAVAAGAIILSGCKTERLVLLDGRRKEKRCVGLTARPVGGPAPARKIEIRAKATISACGSLISSGLKNPNIGKNLHLHPVILAWGYFPDPPSDIKGRSFEGGIITSIHKIAGAGRTRAIVEALSLGPAGYGSLFPWSSGKMMKETMMKYGRTAQIFALVRDRESSGKVVEEGKVSYRLQSSDMEDMKVGLRTAIRILAAAGAAEVGTYRSDGQRIRVRVGGEMEMEEFLDGLRVADGPGGKDGEWMVYGSAHQMGSCRMSEREEDGGVDVNGESWEAEGLFVVDGSVLRLWSSTDFSLSLSLIFRPWRRRRLRGSRRNACFLSGSPPTLLSPLFLSSVIRSTRPAVDPQRSEASRFDLMGLGDLRGLTVLPKADLPGLPAIFGGN